MISDPSRRHCRTYPLTCHASKPARIRVSPAPTHGPLRLRRPSGRNSPVRPLSETAEFEFTTGGAEVNPNGISRSAGVDDDDRRSSGSLATTSNSSGGGSIDGGGRQLEEEGDSLDWLFNNAAAKISDISVRRAYADMVGVLYPCGSNVALSLKYSPFPSLISSGTPYRFFSSSTTYDHPREGLQTSARTQL